MSTWIDRKYVGLISGRLLNFRSISRNYNFSCPICGDSRKSKYKARGWILEQADHLTFYCHNGCGSKSFKWFLEFIDPTLYSEYRMEKFKESLGDRVEVKELETFKGSEFSVRPKISGIKKVSSLPENHIAKIFLRNRSISENLFDRLFFTDKFKKFTNSLVPDKFDDINKDEPRIILPFYTRDGDLFGFSGRSFKSDAKVKYMTILLDYDHPRVFNLNMINESLPILVLEGQFDAMLLNNAIASAGGSLISELPMLEYSKDSYVIVYDNEPRSVETPKKIAKAIRAGYKVCIWPDKYEHKDINDAVSAGITIDRIEQVITENTYSGLLAFHRLNEWKR